MSCMLMKFLINADYVCVLDIDLLELAITTWKGSDTGKLVSAHHLCTCMCFLHLHPAVMKNHSNKMTTPARENVNKNKTL